MANLVGRVTRRWTRSETPPMHLGIIPFCLAINVFSFRMRNFVTPIIESVRTPARITPYPTGRLFGVALSQALRARLRSHRPSGTFRNRLWLGPKGQQD